MVKPNCKPKTETTEWEGFPLLANDCQVFSTDRVFFQQQQADHHNVDICPDGAVLEKTGNLQKENRLVKQQYSPAEKDV